jgi:phospholipid/cholesterol/gamma-HCH transport system permease protein
MTPRNPRVAVARSAGRVAGGTLDGLAEVGRHTRFYAGTIRDVFVELLLKRRYMKEILRHVSTIAVGTGGLVVGGGLLTALIVMNVSVGGEAGLQGYKALETLGAEDFSGIVGSFAVVRIIIPVVSGIAYAGQVGAGFTAEIGAMRITEEIDALEVMSVKSRAYLVCTRMVAGIIVMVPMYFVALYVGFLGVRITAVNAFGVSSGLYQYYFDLYLPPIDILYSGIQVLVLTVVLTLVHCYYGYNASGGPVGVGIAVGRAVRLSMILVAVLSLVMQVIFWGTGDTVSLSG